MSMVLVATFAGLVLIRIFAVLVLAFFVIRPVRSCPACFAVSTIKVRRPLVRLLGARFEWRWCPDCGWEALASSQRRT